MPWLPLLFTLAVQPTPAYLNPSLPAKVRAADLVGRMTLDEKISQMQNEAPGIAHLGIPAYDWWSEALHGAIGSPVTVYPQVIGLAATFDTQLMSKIGGAISDEGRARYDRAIAKGSTGMHEGLTFWAPNINIFRDPRWGRGQETYGEDPFLTSRMAVEYVKALQGESHGRLKAISTPKHFAVHSGPDPERHRFNATPDPRDLWNTYLPAFRTCVQEGGAWSVMSAYSSLDGVPDSANASLLQEILRDKFGFRGYVVSDCGAISDILYGHHYTTTMGQAAADAVKAGCDLECGDSYRSLKSAVADGLIDEATIDKSVGRLFEARMRLGMFDKSTSGPWAKIPMSVVDSPEHRQLALRAARESVTLLKNDGFLPLKGISHLAVIGPNANDSAVPLGNYNGMPSHTVTVLEGIKAVAPSGVTVEYEQGSARLMGTDGVAVPASALPGGVHGQYFAGQNLEGGPIYETDTPTLDFTWPSGSGYSQVPAIHYSARWTTTLTPPSTGDYWLGVRSDDGSRLKVDGKLLTNDWTEHGPRTTAAPIHLEVGKTYHIEVEFFQAEGGAEANLVWSPPGHSESDAAVALAKRSDAVVLVLGISGELEGEELDRTTIELPQPQQDLLKAVEATGKPVVLVLESGSCIALDPTPVKGLVEAWYPGEQGGMAVAEVLFGKVNPSGKLPVTFYKSLDEVPPFEDYKMDGRTYRYLHEAPLFPFGFGLSYTRFAYSDLAVYGGKNNLNASVQVRNTGSVAGDEVVEVYASRKGAAWPEPLRKLVGFARVSLQPEEEKTVRIPIRFDAMAQADGNGKLGVVPGEYEFKAGDATADRRL